MPAFQLSGNATNLANLLGPALYTNSDAGLATMVIPSTYANMNPAQSLAESISAFNKTNIQNKMLNAENAKRSSFFKLNPVNNQSNLFPAQQSFQSPPRENGR